MTICGTHQTEFVLMCPKCAKQKAALADELAAALKRALIHIHQNAVDTRKQADVALAKHEALKGREA